MAIRIEFTKNLPVCRVTEMYLAEGWFESDPGTEYVRKMLAGSYEVAAAFDGSVLCGMMRALSDGISDAYLLDLVVSKEYRHRGIGGMIVKALSGSLSKRGIDWTVCIGASGTDNFYAHTAAKIMDGCVPYRFPKEGN